MDEKAKIDVVDLINNVLMEHERSLDYLIERLETIVQVINEILSENGELSIADELDKNQELSNRVHELERQIQEYRAREIAVIDALSSLYPMEQAVEISAAA